MYRQVPKPQTATIRGSVRDGPTGRPVSGAFVAARWPARQGRERTDSTGTFVLDWVEPGMVYLDLHCPSRTGLGDSLLTTIVKARVGGGPPEDMRVDLTIAQSHPPNSPLPVSQDFLTGA